MNVINNADIEQKKEWLRGRFKEYSENIILHYHNVKDKVTTWEYSLGEIHSALPYERLIPSIRKEGKRVSRLNKSHTQSKNLVSYGFDGHGELLLSISRYDKDVEKYGENVRYIDFLDEEKIIVNAHIYEANTGNSKANSLCCIYKNHPFTKYVSVTPPNDWFVRIDETSEGKITKSLMFATSWFRQIEYELHYDKDCKLSKITTGEYLHWDASK